MLLIIVYTRLTFSPDVPKLRFVAIGYFAIPRKLLEKGMTIHHYLILDANGIMKREMTW